MTIMKRKVIRQGKGTLTMSLPSQWVRQTGIKAGQELSVEQRGLQLLIGPSLGKKPAKKTEVDLTGFSRSLVYVVLNNLYIRGDDELHIRFSKHEQYEAIVENVRNMLGFEIIEHTKNTCVLKALAHVKGEDFDTLLRRILLLILSMAEEGLDALKRHDVKTLKSIERRDESVNVLVLYCLRVLNKHGGCDLQKAMHLYTLLTLLEQLGDEYTRFYREVHKLKQTTYGLANRVAKMLREFYELFYKFDKAKASALKDERDAVRAVIDKTLPQTGAREDLLALHHLRRIGDLIIDIEKFHLAMQL